MKRPILFFLFAILTPVSLLLPQPSRALDFTFFFNPSGIQTMLLNDDGSQLALHEAEGVVRGLDDNRAGQLPDEVLITRSSTDPLAIGPASHGAGQLVRTR